MSAEIATLGFKVDSSGLTTANKKLVELEVRGRKAEIATKELDKTFVSLKGAIGLAAAALASFGAGNAAVETIFSFDKAMKGLEATSRASVETMAQFEKQARSLGATSQFSATQAAEAQRFLAMAGFDANKILASTPKVLELATAANIDLAQAADIASNVLGGLQLPVEQMGRVMDVLAETAASANTDIVQLASAMKNAAPIATAAGVQIEELSAIIGALSDSGLQAERAGTGVAGIIRQVANVTPTAEKALAKYGLTVADLSIESHGLTGVMKNLNAANLSAGDAITIFGSEAAAAGLIVSAYSDRVASMTERYKGAAGAAKQMSDVMNQSLAAGALGVASALGEVALQIGDSGLTGAMKQGMLATTAFIHVFTGMLPEFAEANNLTSEYVNSVMAAVDAAKALVTVVGVGVVGVMLKLAAATATTTASTIAYNIALARMSGLTSAYAVVAGVATVATNALGVAARFAMGPWGLLVTAIGVAASTFMSSKQQADELSNTLSTQKARVDELADSYDGLNRAGKAIFWTKSNSEIAENASKMAMLTAEIEKQKSKLNDSLYGGRGGGIARAEAKARISNLEKEIDLLSKQSDIMSEMQDKVFNRSMPNNWVDGSKQKEEGGKKTGGGIVTSDAIAKVDEYANQIAQLNTLTSELGKTESELFVMRQMAQAQANGANAEQLQRVYELSTAYTMQKSALDEVAQAQQEAKAAADQQKSAYDSWVSSIESAHKSASVLQQEIAKIDEAMKAGDVSEYAGTKAIKQLEDQIKSLSAIAANPFDQMVAGSKEALGAMSGMFESGSKDAQKLAVAMQALNLVQAVGAVLNQGNGDPYTAFGRMAAMATMVGSLGMSINSLSGGFGDESGAAQSSQGTTIWGEKSESIANSIDMTANATQKLVGINTSMLGALRTMQSGILAAAGLISRDAVTPVGDVSGKLLTSNPFGGALGKLTDFTSKIVDPLGLFGKAFDKLLGGKSKVTDEGIQIVGDSLAGVIDSVMVQGFQNIKYKKWRFGSTKNTTVFNDLTDVVGDQVSLVFSSMRDSVMAGATALGLSQTEIETALNNFQIATTQISLKGLDAEAQQKEIEAVFSQIFDGMAESVIPFIGQFQRVGEGMGETLARVATQVAVTEEAVRRFGFAFADKMLNPEAFAQAADNLSMLVGGVDELASKTASFVQFASAEKQLAIAQDDLTRAFAEVGLTVPESSAALWELMSTLDGTTEAGLSQIATLLNLQDAAANYYSLLEREQEKQKAAADKAAGELAREKAALITLAQKAADDEYKIKKDAADAALAIAKDQYDAESEALAASIEHTKGLISELEQEYRARQDALSAAGDAARSAFDAEISLIEKLSNERISALEKERSAVESSIEMLGGIAESAKGVIDSIYSTVAVKQSQLDAALIAARAGDFSGAANLDLAGSFSSQDSFSTQSGFLLAQAVTANKISELGALAGEQKTIEEKTLESIDAQITAIESQTEQQIAVLEGQLDALLGVDNTALSIKDATEQYQNAKLALDSLMFDESMSMLNEHLARLDLMVRSNEEVYQMHVDYYDKQLSDAAQMRDTALEQLEELKSINANSGASSNASLEELIAEIRLLRQEQQVANAALADNTNATANELRNINFDGIEVRA